MAVTLACQVRQVNVSWPADEATHPVRASICWARRTHPHLRIPRRHRRQRSLSARNTQPRRTWSPRGQQPSGLATLPLGWIDTWPGGGASGHATVQRKRLVSTTLSVPLEFWSVVPVEKW